MGRKKRPSANQNPAADPRPQQQQQSPAQQSQPQSRKKARHHFADDPELTGESYAIKKYRPDKFYTAMDAFVKYTKQHRMLDATYVRWKTGVTPEKPHVYSTRVGGIDLGWGRGKTREAAMDCACRAAFALVAAHGYNNFPLDDDCLASKPVNVAPPPPPLPPPPPPPREMAPPRYGVIPPPVGPPPLEGADLIPQAQIGATSAPVATSLSSTPATTLPPPPTVTPGLPPPPASATAAAPATAGISLDLSKASTSGNSSYHSVQPKKKQLKGGFTLVFDGGEGGNELSMEEIRSQLPRYQTMMARATVSKAVATLPCLVVAVATAPNDNGLPSL